MRLDGRRIIAHEVGHHVQFLLGTLDRVHREQERVGETESNRLSVRLELQADFYAGIWAYYDNQYFASLEEGDGSFLFSFSGIEEVNYQTNIVVSEKISVLF